MERRQKIIMNLTPEAKAEFSKDQRDKITAAKIHLLDNNPFFSYLIQHLRIHERENLNPPTMAVDNFGNLYYHPQFVSKLNQSQLCGVLAHEALHCALEHITRTGKRDAIVWNIAIDLAVNSLVKLNSTFSLPPNGYIPDGSDCFSFGSFKIKDISKKFAEELYAELLKNATIVKVTYLGFDSHIKTDDPGQTPQGKMPKLEQGQDPAGATDIRTNPIDWKSVLCEAHTHAKLKGEKSGGLERVVENAVASRINWKSLLYKFITQNIPNDFTYRMPSKRFYSTGYYFPNTTKQEIDIFVAIDTSGSITEKDLGQFLKEIIKIGNSFDCIKITFVTHDSEVKQKIVFNKNNLNNLKSIKPIGGGGTSHVGVFDEAKKSKAKVLICFTDGMSDIERIKTRVNTIFVLTDRCFRPKFGKYLYLEDYLE